MRGGLRINPFYAVDSVMLPSCYETETHSTNTEKIGRSASIPHFSTAGGRVERGRQQTKAVNQFPHFNVDDRVGFELRLAAACVGAQMPISNSSWATA